MNDPQGLIGYFGKHLIGLCFFYRWKTDDPGDPPRVATSSGTLMAFGNIFCLVTAGHVVDEVREKFLENPDVEFLACRLIDSVGSQAKHEDMVPIAWTELPMVHLNEDGLDFALIALHANTVRLLDANGVIAIREEQWDRQHTVKFDGYMLMGLPQELASGRAHQVGDVTVQSVLMHVESAEVPPDLPVTTYKPFAGRIVNRGSLNSVKGTSGGPIFGYRAEQHDGRERLRYWVVAIQSAQMVLDRDLIIGCPIPVFGKMTTDALDRMNAARENGQK
jgi:hypothetical protein